MIDDEIEIAKLFNEYFVNIVKKLGLFKEEQSAISTENSLSEVEIAIAKYGYHPSIIAITKKMDIWLRLQFVWGNSKRGQ